MGRRRKPARTYAKPGTDRAMQDRFFDLLRAGHGVHAACRMLGRVYPTQFYNARTDDADFAARWAAAQRAEVNYRKPETPWTNELREAFLRAIVEHGSAAAAARALGVPQSSAYAVRNRDAEFAAAWYAARRQVAEQIDDKLMDGALHGYEEVVEVEGRVVRRTRRANPRIMLKIVERIEADQRSQGRRFVEITPERVAQARATLLRRLTNGGSLTTMAEAIAEAARTPATAAPPASTPEPDPAEIEDAVPGRSLWD